MMFSNVDIKASAHYKPHIVLRDGYWRVSPLIKICNTKRQWGRAYLWAYKANDARAMAVFLANRDESIRNTEKKLLNKVALF